MGRRNNSEMLHQIKDVDDTYIESRHPNVYEGAEYYHKIKSIPGITKIVLQVYIIVFWSVVVYIYISLLLGLQ